MVDGLILMEVLAHDERVPFVADLGGPAVLLGVPDDPKGLPYVDFDFEAAGRLCVSTSPSSATNEIGFLAPPQGIFDMGFGLRPSHLAGHRRRAGKAPARVSRRRH